MTIGDWRSAIPCGKYAIGLSSLIMNYTFSLFFSREKQFLLWNDIII